MLKTIVLIDDDYVTNFINERLLKEMNAAKNILSFKNGKEAIDYFTDYEGDETPADLIFLDINMPVMDGFAFMEAYKKLNVIKTSNYVIAMLTSSTLEEEKKIAEKLGVLEHINKPLTKEKVEYIINKYL